MEETKRSVGECPTAALGATCAIMLRTAWGTIIGLLLGFGFGVVDQLTSIRFWLAFERVANEIINPLSKWTSAISVFTLYLPDGLVGGLVGGLIWGLLHYESNCART